jgi:glycosyltransferase involved in cell wall biosynthesis
MREKVSVLITCYNYGRYLGQCLESVLSQSRPADEIVLVDDGSEDDTPEIAHRFSQIRYIRQKNGGYAAASNRAFKEASGNILCHLDADDYWLPSKLERVMEVFEQSASLGGVVHDTIQVDAEGRRLSASPPAVCSSAAEVLRLENTEGCGFLYRLPQLKPRMFGNPTTIAVRRAAIEDLFPVPEGPPFAVDGVFLCGALRAGVSYLPEVLAAYRVHGTNLWADNPMGDLQIIRMWEYLANNPVFAKSLTPRHADLFRATILERMAYIASRTGQDKLRGALAAVRVPLITLKHGLFCHWKHLALPIICFVPLKRSSPAVAIGKSTERERV